MVPIYPLAPNTAPLQRGPWRSGQEGRSLQPEQGGRLVALGLEPGVVLLILRTLVSFLCSVCAQKAPARPGLPWSCPPA